MIRLKKNRVLNEPIIIKRIPLNFTDCLPVLMYELPSEWLSENGHHSVLFIVRSDHESPDSFSFRGFDNQHSVQFTVRMGSACAEHSASK